jgi:non-ribosomal peptide synthetase component E (peptide arylation enzyme)
VIDGDGKDLPPNREGELVSKGPGIFTGYFKSAEENKAIFTEDGFFRTGDLAEIDELGNIRITGRIKDIIIRGGENISAIDIENLVSEHPGVEEVAVVGMPDEVLGERICAYIQPTRGSELSFEEVISFLKSKGASVLQLPERIEFVDRIPLTKVGKIDKKALREGIKKRLQNERA